MKKINEMIDHVMLEEPASYRPYLGMSQIGNPDERMLWLNFRWCLPPNSFEPRISRILDLGQHLEDIIVDYLKKTQGFEVFEKDKKGKHNSHTYFSPYMPGTKISIIFAVGTRLCHHF